MEYYMIIIDVLQYGFSSIPLFFVIHSAPWLCVDSIPKTITEPQFPDPVQAAEVGAAGQIEQ